MGHIVDEIGFHFVEFALATDGARGDVEEDGDDNEKENRDSSNDAGIAHEEWRRWKIENDIVVGIFDGSFEMVAIFIRGVEDVLFVVGMATIENFVERGIGDGNVGIDIDAVDKELFGDDGVEVGVVELTRGELFELRTNIVHVVGNRDVE